MKIAMVSEHASPLASPGAPEIGGQNVHVAALSAALADLGHNVTVFTRRDDMQMPTVVHRSGYRVVHVPAGPPTYVPRDQLLGYMKEFSHFLHGWWACERPDVVHAHFWMSGMAAAEAAAPLSIRSLVTFHALGSVKRRYQGSSDTSPGARIRIEHCVAHAVDKIVATCTDEVSELARLGISSDRTVIIPCGVDAELFSPADGASSKSAKKRILSVGRLVPRKGFSSIIAALKDVPDAEAIIAGGPEESSLKDDREVKRLRELARECGVDQRVTFLGRVPHTQMPELMRSCDVIACTPQYEPFGIVPLEAMACGRPVVATAVGGLKDTVRDGVTGFLVPPRHTEALAAALKKLTDDSELAAQMGREGRELISGTYSWKDIATRTAEVYRGVVAQRPGALPTAV